MRTRSRPQHHDVLHQRLSLLQADAEPELGTGADHREGTGPPDAPVPVPGRHASRRAGSTPVPEPLRGRVALGPWQLVVVAVAVVCGLIITAWWLVRGQARPTTEPVASRSASALVSPVADDVSAAPSSPAGSGAAGTDAAGIPVARASPSGTVLIDVDGKVRRPGVVELADGARVIDAVKAAGGARHRRDLTGLNLAAVVADGEQIIVGRVPGAGGSVSSAEASGSDAAPAAGTPVNLNTATGADLEALPGVGPVTAQAILDWRAANGRFSTVEELIEVDGIGEKTLADLTPLVTL